MLLLSRLTHLAKGEQTVCKPRFPIKTDFILQTVTSDHTLAEGKDLEGLN